jgi:hypothetical protein
MTMSDASAPSHGTARATAPLGTPPTGMWIVNAIVAGRLAFVAVTTSSCDPGVNAGRGGVR